MAYTVWKDGIQIGRTDLELRLGGRKRAGAFMPNENGLTVLPGITAMLPALISFSEMCRRLGMAVDDYCLGNKRFPFESFAATPEGQAVAEAARHLRGVELRDSRGQTVVWEILLISDMDEVRSVVREQTAAARVDASGDAKALYFISVTLAPRLQPAFDALRPHDSALTTC